MVKDGFKYPLKTLDQMPRDPADCRPIFSLASAGATWPIKFWKSQRLEISDPFCYPPWFPPGFKHYHWDFTFPYNQHELLLLLLNVASCPFSVPLWVKLGFISPSSIHWGGWTTQFSSPLSCLSFPGGSRAELSSPSPWLPHSQWKHTASSPIMLTAPTLAGPLCWPSGWEHHSSVTLLVSAKQLSSLISRTYPSPAPRNVPVTAWSQQQSTGLSVVWAGLELPSQARLRAQAKPWAGKPDLQPGWQTAEQRAYVQGTGWGARASARHPRHRQTQPQLLPCVSQLRLQTPSHSHLPLIRVTVATQPLFLWFPWYQYTIAYVTLKIRSSVSVLHLKL